MFIVAQKISTVVIWVTAAEEIYTGLLSLSSFFLSWEKKDEWNTEKKVREQKRKEGWKKIYVYWVKELTGNKNLYTYLFTTNDKIILAILLCAKWVDFQTLLSLRYRYFFVYKLKYYYADVNIISSPFFSLLNKCDQTSSAKDNNDKASLYKVPSTQRKAIYT